MRYDGTLGNRFPGVSVKLETRNIKWVHYQNAKHLPVVVVAVARTMRLHRRNWCLAPSAAHRLYHTVHAQAAVTIVDGRPWKSKKKNKPSVVSSQPRPES
jgi:hypothetical protein